MRKKLNLTKLNRSGMNTIKGGFNHMESMVEEMNSCACLCCADDPSASRAGCRTAGHC